MRKPTIVITVAMALLAGCSQTQVKEKPVFVFQPRPEPVEPAVAPVKMLGVEWKVITKPELEKILADLEKNPDPNFTLIALTPKGYENLSRNLVEINRFMQEQQQVILYYRTYNRETAGQLDIPVPKPKPKS